MYQRVRRSFGYHFEKIPFSFDSLGSRLGLKEQKRKELYAKQGRGSQFTSRDQRDLWIQNELKSLSKAIKEKNEQIERLQEDLKVSNVTGTLKVCPILIGPFFFSVTAANASSWRRKSKK
jgi:hypothetical protein